MGRPSTRDRFPQQGQLPTRLCTAPGTFLFREPSPTHTALISIQGLGCLAPFQVGTGTALVNYPLINCCLSTSRAPQPRVYLIRRKRSSAPAESRAQPQPERSQGPGTGDLPAGRSGITVLGGE